MAAPVTQASPAAAPPVQPVGQPVAPAIASEPQLGSTLNSYFAALDPIVGPVTDVFRTLSDVRKSLNLPNPGAVERLQNEVKSALMLTSGANYQLYV